MVQAIRYLKRLWRGKGGHSRAGPLRFDLRFSVGPNKPGRKSRFIWSPFGGQRRFDLHQGNECSILFTGQRGDDALRCDVKTMKALLGIDHEGSYRHALSMLRRLDFPNCEVHLAAVVHPEVDVMAAVGPGAFSNRLALMDPIERLADDSVKAADSDLQEAAVRAMAIDPSPQTTTLFGDAASQLMNYANDIGASLIAADRTISGAFNAFTMGSVCRALTISAKQSVLITKGEIEPKGEVRAVYATDLSAYGEHCLNNFIDMNPGGLSHITVMHAVEHGSVHYYRGLPGDTVEMVLESNHAHDSEALKSTEKVAGKLMRVARSTRTQFMVGKAQDLISKAMNDSKADLLILGAQGHGFFERLAIGSVALHSVVAENYPVLIIRA